MSFSSRRTILILVMAVLLQGLLVISSVAGATLRVPSQYATIQSAINRATAGDVVLVSPGQYVGRVVFGGKEITVKSLYETDPTAVANTVITPGAWGSAVCFTAGETRNSVLAGFTISGGDGTQLNVWRVGGGIYCNYGSSPRILANIIKWNNADKGGGIFVGRNCRAEITGNTIEGNTASGRSDVNDGAGGGVYALCGTISRNVILTNTAKDGGGVHAEGATLVDNQIRYNVADAYGGGIYATLCTVRGGMIEENTSQASGGGAMMRGSTLTGVTVQNNTALDNWPSASYKYGEGGGIYAQHYVDEPVSTKPIIEDCDIIGNIAQRRGGGAYCDVEVKNCRIFGNTAGHQGGGIWGSGRITGNVIASNTARFGEAMFAWQGGGGVVQSNTFYRNNVTVDVRGYTRLIKNCVFAQSTLIAVSEDIPLDDLFLSQKTRALSDLQVSYCNRYPVPAGEEDGGLFPRQNWNIAVDPLFADAAGWNFRLRSAVGRWNGSAWVRDTVTSPCIDAGDPSSECTLEPAPNNGVINMGFDGNTAQASKSIAMAGVIPAPRTTGVPVTTSVFISFRWPVEQSLAASRVQLKWGSSKIIPTTLTWVTANRKIKLRPKASLLPDTYYRINIDPGIRYTDGRVVSWGENYWFKTAPATTTAAVTVAAASTAGGAELTVDLTSAATVRTVITNIAGRAVAELPERDLPAGVSSLLWNGKSSSGSKVPFGTYLVRVVAIGSDGEQTTAVAPLQIR